MSYWQKDYLVERIQRNLLQNIFVYQISSAEKQQSSYAKYIILTRVRFYILELGCFELFFNTYALGTCVR